MRDGKGRCLRQDYWVVSCCHQLYTKWTYHSLKCPLGRTLSLSRLKHTQTHTHTHTHKYRCCSISYVWLCTSRHNECYNESRNSTMACVPGVCMCVCKYIKLIFYYYFSRLHVSSVQNVELKKKLHLLWKRSCDSTQNTETRLYVRQRRNYLSNPGRSKCPHWVWSPSTLPFNRYRRLFYQG
jgi:hypothetical protein